MCAYICVYILCETHLPIWLVPDGTECSRRLPLQLHPPLPPLPDSACRDTHLSARLHLRVHVRVCLCVCRGVGGGTGDLPPGAHGSLPVDQPWRERGSLTGRLQTGERVGRLQQHGNLAVLLVLFLLLVLAAALLSAVATLQAVAVELQCVVRAAGRHGGVVKDRCLAYLLWVCFKIHQRPEREKDKRTIYIISHSSK